MENDRHTLVVNLFAGPGAGKTTCAWEIAAELKKCGYVVEYVSEAAKEYVWDNNMGKLNGSIENQQALFREQNHRVHRLLGKVDMVVTDSPILLNPMYLSKPNTVYSDQVFAIFKKQNNFNIFIRRGSQFEKAGRIHNLSQSMTLDNQIENMLTKHQLFYGKYTYSQIKACIQNIVTTFDKLQARETEIQQKKQTRKLSERLSR